VLVGLFGGFYVISINNATYSVQQPISTQKYKHDNQISKAFELLKVRKDSGALAIFEQVLIGQPENLDALWGKAEVLRRGRKYKESEDILEKILKKNPKHTSSLISLAYIRYKDDKLIEALRLVKESLQSSYADKENQALAYMMLGTINSRRSQKGWFFSKLKYGTQIKYYFLKARGLSWDLPEVHLGLGTFYLLAPAIAGGNLNKALEELNIALKIAPDFATVNARLAQGYKKKGDLEKFNSYILRTEELDPGNEVLKEIRNSR
jgi:tetratricopeptide (TPR) repeat protein